MEDELSSLIFQNKNLIYSIVHHFNNGAEIDDLFQIGVIGLIKAYQNYNESMNTKFTTYAYPYIFGEISKYVRENKGIKISRDISKLNLKIEKVSILLSQKLMREPTISEIAEFLEVPEYLVAEARNSINSLCSLDNEYEVNLHEVISDTKTTDINTLIALKEELSKLSDDEKLLIKNRYISDLTQSETANIMGMSQVQVSRKENKVLTKIRDRLVS